jgi:hypothetical protein
VENIGTILFVAQGTTALYRIRPDGTNKELIAVIPELADSISSLEISPKGDRILFLQYKITGGFTAHLVSNTEIRQLPLPRLLHISWSPDGAYILGTVYEGDTSRMPFGSLYLYSLSDGKETVFPIKAVGTWGEDSNTIIYAKSTTTTQPGAIGIFEDIFQYDRVTQQEKQLTYTNTIPVEFGNGSRGTDLWRITRVHTFANSPYIFFLGVPHSLVSGSGTSTSSWKRIPRKGLGKGEEPESILLVDLDLRVNSVDATIVAGVRSTDRSECSNGLVVRDVDNSIYEEVLVPAAIYESAGRYINDVHWSPNGRQIVFHLLLFDCTDIGFELSDTILSSIYIWDSVTNPMQQLDTYPRFLVEGRSPIWIVSGELGFSD